MSEWLDTIDVPGADNDVEWGAWIAATTGDGPVPAPSDDLRELFLAPDDNAETGQTLGRFLAQIWPLGEDRALAESEGIRIMTMGGIRAGVCAARGRDVAQDRLRVSAVAAQSRGEA